MKPTLDIQLLGLSQVRRDRIKDTVNELIESNDVWKKMWAINEHQNDDGKWVLFLRVPFFTNIKRNKFRGKIRSEIMKNWRLCEVGSYIAEHECDHDESGRRGCRINKILEKKLK